MATDSDPTHDEPPDIVLRGLTKRYGDVTAVDGVDLEIRRGEFFTMLGPSGSGKTTTLRMIAGFEQPDEGKVELGVALRARLDELAGRHAAIGEVRGLGPMLALELREQSPDLAQRITAAAFERGLLLLSCGLYGNVLRLLPPLTVSDEELGRGLELLEESLAAAG